MWLINTTTFQLEERDPSSTKYVILSHTWETDEVSFRDMENPEKASKKKGFSKIRKTCDIARSDNFEWAWVDTCCIDKSSSAELTESINSMFRWYNEACVCYVYLSDLRPAGPEPVPGGMGVDVGVEELGRCRWFTRGWTLQELIASKVMLVFDQDWALRGTKANMKPMLEAVTGIDESVLGEPASVYEVPVSRRMSWAAKRQTTRVEDMAYSLFGIFDVNLPLIYGEGEKSFLRLQEAILQNSTDLSLFAWEPQETASNHQLFRGLFATSPSEFDDGDCVRPLFEPATQSLDIRLSNKGVHFSPDILMLTRQILDWAPLWEYPVPQHLSCEEEPTKIIPSHWAKPERMIHVVNLNLYWDRDARRASTMSDISLYPHVCLELFRMPDYFVRRKRLLLSEKLQATSGSRHKIEVYIPRHVSPRQSQATLWENDHTFRVVCDPPGRLKVTGGYPTHLWHPETSTFHVKAQAGFVGMIKVKVLPPPAGISMLGRNWFHPEFHVFFGLELKGRDQSSSSSTTTPGGALAAWVNMPPQSDPFLGRRTRKGGYGQMEMAKLVGIASSPSSHKSQTAFPGPRPMIAAYKSYAGPFTLHPECEDGRAESQYNLSLEKLMSNSAKVWAKVSPCVGEVRLKADSKSVDKMTENLLSLHVAPAMGSSEVSSDGLQRPATCQLV